MTDYYGFTTIATSLDDGILRVALNRPDRLNALDRPMHKELRSLFEQIAHDENVRVVVLTGDGRAFCVGADFQQMRDNLAAGDYPDGRPDMLSDGTDIARGILRVRQPMIAMGTVTRSASARPSPCSATSSTCRRRRRSAIRTCRRGSWPVTAAACCGPCCSASTGPRSTS